MLDGAIGVFFIIINIVNQSFKTLLYLVELNKYVH